MTDSSSSPQMKRKLLDDESEDLEPDQKTARTDEDDDVSAEEAAAAEVQELLARRKATAKEVIEREYEEVTMAPEGQHSDFVNEIQSRAEIVNKGAVQNEGLKSKFLDKLAGQSSDDNIEDEDEAAALAIIRGTHTGVEDSSVGPAGGSTEADSAAVERMHEATGIPRGLKFDINIDPEDLDDDTDVVEDNINLDVVVALPRLNTDLQKARSALAFKGTMKKRRLPVRTVSGSKLVTAEDREQRLAEVIAREERLSRLVEDETRKERPKPAVTPRPAMSTADKVRQALAEKLARPAKEEKKANGQDQPTPDWVLARQQKQILKQSYKPDGGYAATVQSGEQVEAARDRSSSRSSLVEEKDERKFKPSLRKLAALEKPRERATVESSVVQVQLRKTSNSGSPREGSVERDDKRTSGLSLIQLKKTEQKAGKDAVTSDQEQLPFSQVNLRRTAREVGTEAGQQAKKAAVEDRKPPASPAGSAPITAVRLKSTPRSSVSASPEPSKPEVVTVSAPITAVRLKSTPRSSVSASPEPSKPEVVTVLKKTEERRSLSVSEDTPAVAHADLHFSGHRQSPLEKDDTGVSEDHSMEVDTDKEPVARTTKEVEDEKPVSGHISTVSAKKETKPFQKGPPPAIRKKPVHIGVPSDDVPAWKKALIERRKVPKVTPARQNAKQDVPSDADKIPQWKRELMLRRKRSEDRLNIGTTASEPRMTVSQDPPWARDRRDRKDSTASMTQLNRKMSKVSVSSDGDAVPSFIREFESRRKKNVAAVKGPEPEWKKQMMRRKSEQEMNVHGNV